MDKLPESQVKLPVTCLWGKLVKLSDDVFGGKHPNNINEGYVKEAIFDKRPEIGSPFYIGSLRTTLVTEIVSDTETEVIFKTKNSTYKLTDITTRTWN